MTGREIMKAALQDARQRLFGDWAGRVVVGASLVAQGLHWHIEGEPWWALLVRLAAVPVYLAVTIWAIQFLAGAAFALVHAWRPKRSFVVLDLKDGRQRRCRMDEAPCCLRSKIKNSLKNHGAVTWTLGDGSDDEEFREEEIEDWRVMPCDDPHVQAS